MAIDVSGFIPDNSQNPALYKMAETLERYGHDKRQMDYRRQRDQEEKQNQYRLFNIREIDQDTDFSKFKTGEERFDSYTQKELQRVRDNAYTKYVNLPPEEAKYKIGQDIKDLAQWHSAVTANLQNVKEGLTSLNKTHSNIDPQGAHELAYLNLANDYLEKDQQGNLVRKKPELVTPKNYVADVLKPENLSKLQVDVSPFQKAIESIPKASVGEKEYTSKRGYVHKFDWGGLKTDYSEIVEDEKGRPKEFQLRTDRKVGDIKLIPNDLKDYLINQPQVKVAADRLWAIEKQRIEESSGQKIDSKIEPELHDAFLYKMANKYLPHDIKISTGEATPRPSNTYNFFGTQMMNAPIDLSGYKKTEAGDYDISELMRGVKISGTITGKSFESENVLYNPRTKTFTYYDPLEGKAYQKPFTKFLQDVTASNPNLDVKFLTRLYKSEGGGDGKKPEKSEDKTETVAERMRRLAGQKK